MQIINKYILKKFCILCLCVLLCFAILLWLIYSIKHLQLIVNNNISIEQYFKLVLLLFPDIISKIAPISCALSCALIYSKQTLDNELQILQTIGKSPLLISMPSILVCFVISIISLYINASISPKMFRNFRDQQVLLNNKISGSLIKIEQFNYLKDKTIYVAKKDDDNTYHNIFIYQLNKNSKQVYIFAKYGQIFKINDLMFIKLYNGFKQETDKNGNITNFAFEQIDYKLLEPKTKEQRFFRHDELSLNQLLDDSDFNNSKKNQISAHQKIITPFLCFLNSLAASVLMVVNRPSRRNRRFKVLILMIFAILSNWFVISFLQLTHKINYAIFISYLAITTCIILFIYLIAKSKTHYYINRFFEKCGI